MPEMNREVGPGGAWRGFLSCFFFCYALFSTTSFAFLFYMFLHGGVGLLLPKALRLKCLGDATFCHFTMW